MKKKYFVATAVVVFVLAFMNLALIPSFFNVDLNNVYQLQNVNLLYLIGMQVGNNLAAIYYTIIGGVTAVLAAIALIKASKTEKGEPIAKGPKILLMVACIILFAHAALSIIGYAISVAVYAITSLVQFIGHFAYESQSWEFVQGLVNARQSWLNALAAIFQVVIHVVEYGALLVLFIFSLVEKKEKKVEQKEEAVDVEANEAPVEEQPVEEAPTEEEKPEEAQAE